MIKSIKTIKIMAISGLMVGGVLSSCVGDPNSPGVEYMPDMYRSGAVEAYYDYGHFKGEYVDSLVKENPALLPPAGTIPFSSNGLNDIPYAHGAPFGFDKSHGLYGFAFDSTGYADAAADVNPVAFSEEVLEEGEVLYGQFCTHCHADDGGGQGTVVKNSNGKFPPVPSYSNQLKDVPAGQIFFSVTYGKGLMGAHASQMTKEERWKVVYYVQQLQGHEPGVQTDTTTVEIIEGAELPMGEEAHVEAPHVEEGNGH